MVLLTTPNGRIPRAEAAFTGADAALPPTRCLSPLGTWAWLPHVLHIQVQESGIFCCSQRLLKSPVIASAEQPYWVLILHEQMHMAA